MCLLMSYYSPDHTLLLGKDNYEVLTKSVNQEVNREINMTKVSPQQNVNDNAYQ